MHRRVSIASVTFAVAIALTVYKASSPAASKEVPKPAQSFSTLGITSAAPTVPAVRAAAKTPAVRIAQAPSSGIPAPLKKFRVLLPFKVGITFFPISVANELGYLRDEGIDLDLQVANGSSAVVQQVAAGNAEIGVILAPKHSAGLLGGREVQGLLRLFDEELVRRQSHRELADQQASGSEGQADRHH